MTFAIFQYTTAEYPSWNFCVGDH